MTVGLPCLVSSSGELPRVVGSPDYVFDEYSPSELAAKLEAFCMRRRDGPPIEGCRLSLES
jgi:hypothetical protein